TLDVAGAGRLMWMDATMTGRAGRGERWRLSALDHELRLVHDGTLDYLERYRIRPETNACDGPAEAGHHVLTSPWITGQADYFGSVIVKGAGMARELAEQLHVALAAMDGVE